MGTKLFYKILTSCAVVLLILVGVNLYNYYRSENVVVSTPAKSIRTDIKVIIYSKDGCQYCILAKKLLHDKGIPYEVVELTSNRDVFIKLANQTGQNTVPYVFINGEFIGGYSDLLNLNETGKL